MAEFPCWIEREHWDVYLRLSQRRMRLIATKSARFETYGWLLLALAMIAVLPWLFDLKFGPRVALFFALGFFAGWLVLTIYLVVFQKRIGRLSIKSGGLVLGARRLVLSDDGVMVAGRNDQQTFKWAAFDDVDLSNGLMVFWLEPSVGVFIPSEALGDEAAQQEVLATAKSAIAVARGKVL